MKRSCTFVVFALLPFFIGCGGKPEPVRISSDEIDAPRPGATPIEVMENVALAHAARDLELYREQFDPRFEIRLPFGQESWDEAEESHLEKEIETTGAILAASGWVRYAVSLDPPRPSEVEGYPAAEGFREMMARDFDVSIWVAATGDTFTVKDDSALFVFSPEPGDRGERWRIVFQQLFGGGEACGMPATEEADSTE